jgi:alpha-tubulin suppressor-like RCC1 family protein
MRALFFAFALAVCGGCGTGLFDHPGSGGLGNGVCAANEVLCGTCVAENQDSCGTSCAKCTAAPSHGQPACLAHACGYACDPGYFRCSSGCCTATDLAAGGDTTCAIAGGTVHCWGANDSKQLGSALADSESFSATAVEVPGTSNATALAVGARHACAVIGMHVWCWGSNSSGQLGVQGATQSATPVQVPGITDATLVAAGGEHSCATTSSGVTCWGSNSSAQLGTTPGSSSGPVTVPGVGVAQSLAAGFKHTCAVDANGVICWGAGTNGQLGSGSTPDMSAPVRANTSNGVTAITAGNFHTCALSSSLECWGSDSAGQLGDGKSGTANDNPNPHGVGDLTNPVIPIAAGGSHSCAVSQSDGLHAYCWGANASGQLGLGPNPQPDTTKPVRIDSELEMQKLALGGDHSCALLHDGTTMCWGRNDRGQTAATGRVSGPVNIPTPITSR